jgi:hypothetical protein
MEATIGLHAAISLGTTEDNKTEVATFTVPLAIHSGRVIDHGIQIGIDDTELSTRIEKATRAFVDAINSPTQEAGEGTPA